LLADKSRVERYSQASRDTSEPREMLKEAEMKMMKEDGLRPHFFLSEKVLLGTLDLERRKGERGE
jgi:hypothetical protein